MKVRGSKFASALWRIASAITEARDAIKSMYDALPKRCKLKSGTKGPKFSKFSKRRGPTVQQMYAAIYKCASSMSDAEKSKWFNDAVDNLVTDQIKDYVFGKLGREVGKASRRSGRPIGFGAGPAL